MEAQQQELPDKLSRLPDQPGVYLMKDPAGAIIYVGKAGSLKKRVSSYFQKSDHDAKTRMLVKNIADIEYIVTDSEIEALLLESSLIKKHRPKFNIRLKDDKRYPYIAVMLNEEYPRVIFTRSISESTARYFGPYTDARAARQTVSMINRTFRLKTCTKNFPFKKDERPCLNYQMKRCSGVCTGKISREEYLKIIDNAVKFLEGNIEPVINNLNRLMNDYSAKMDYEKAAGFRDIIFNIQKISESQKVFAPAGADQDFIGTAILRNEAILLLFEFRSGALLGRKIFIYQNIEYTQIESIVQTFIIEYYRERDIPVKIIIPREIEDKNAIENYLSLKSSKKVAISLPKTQDDRGILNLIQKNLDLIIADRNSSELAADKKLGLLELKEALNMEKIPEIIECFDISNIQGRHAVASMVQFKNGSPNKSGYRRYKIKTFDAPNDPGMIHEVVSRRLQYLINESQGLPDLIVVDGGAAQLGKAIEARQTLNCEVQIISLAKKFEEIYADIKNKPLRLQKSSPALKILQNIRDEAHRFAITYHKKLRDKASVGSVLDGIPNIGANKKQKLLSHIKNPSMIKDMSLQELEEIPGIGKKAARDIYEFFNKGK